MSKQNVNKVNILKRIRKKIKNSFAFNKKIPNMLILQYILPQ